MPENRYAGLAGTALGNSTLLEIGRCVVHHGLLVEAVREFCDRIGQYCPGFPTSISSRECVGLLPAALSAIAPAFVGKDLEALKQAIDQVALAEDFMDRLRSSYWGVGRGKFSESVHSEKMKSPGCEGCFLDQREFSDADLHQIAWEIALAARYVGRLQAAFDRKLAEEGRDLLKKLKAPPTAKHAVSDPAVVQCDRSRAK